MHTPGPWSIEHTADDLLVVVPAGRDYPICDLGSVNADDYDADVIAALWGDARLIAAAPDLLAALAGLLDEDAFGHASYCELCGSHAPKHAETGALLGPVPHEADCAVGIARAAIRKAEGE